MRKPTIRKAGLRDVPRIRTLVNRFASEKRMLPLAYNQIYERLRDFWVMEEAGSVVACGALKIMWKDLAEIRSLAVSPRKQKRGYGRMLIDRMIGEAAELGIRKVFALTYVPAFFERLGFQRTAKAKLPHKIWFDCINCPKFPRCDETAMLRTL